MIRVLLADDQALVRAGFRMIIDAQPDMTVVAEAADGNDALEQARHERPDVILMDIRMPGIDGIEATRRLIASGCAARILMLTTFDLDEYLYEAMRAGASGFLLKTAPPRQLVAAIRDITGGDTLVAPAITRRLVEEFVHRPRPDTTAPTALSRLTPRELEVLKLIAKGLSNAELAQTLYRQRNHRQDPRRPHPQQARPARPGSSRRHGLRNRHRPPRNLRVTLYPCRKPPEWQSPDSGETRAERLLDKCTVAFALDAGDVVRMLTPGGGGCGTPPGDESAVPEGVAADLTDGEGSQPVSTTRSAGAWRRGHRVGAL